MFFESCLQASLGIFPSPRAYVGGGGNSEFFQDSEPLYGKKAIYNASPMQGVKLGIFPSPRAYMGRELGIFQSPRAFI